MKKIDRRSTIFYTLGILLTILIPIGIHICFKIEAPRAWMLPVWDAGDLLAYAGSILGAIATIIAIYMTINFTRENQRTERKVSIKPFLQSEHYPEYEHKYVNENDSVNRTFITHPFDDKGHIGVSLVVPYTIQKFIEQKEEGTTSLSVFNKNHYVLRYVLSSIGAGNAINITMKFNEKAVMKPFSMGVGSEKEFIILLKSELISDESYDLNITFEFDDVASIGSYIQEETIRLYFEEDNSLNISQSIEGVLSNPRE